MDQLFSSLLPEQRAPAAPAPPVVTTATVMTVASATAPAPVNQASGAWPASGAWRGSTDPPAQVSLVLLQSPLFITLTAAPRCEARETLAEPPEPRRTSQNLTEPK